MLKRVMKRWTSLLLTAVMVIGLLPATVLSASAAEANVSGFSVDGLTATYDGGTVTCEDNVITMTAEGKTESSGCGGGTDTSTTSTLTIKNTSVKVGVLTFSVSNNGGSMSFGATSPAKLAANEAVTITLTSPEGKGKTATATVSNVSFNTDSATVTFQPATGGSYTVNGEKVANKMVDGPEVGKAYAVVATPDTGMKFAGWWSGDQMYNTNPSTNLYFTQDTTITAKFIAEGEANFQVGSALFGDLNVAAAAAAAGSDKTVVVVKDCTLPAGDYTIPVGVTLLVPFDEAGTCYTEAPGCQSNAYTKPSMYRKLTIAPGATITVNGAISVSAKHSSSMSGANPSCTGAVSGSYGQIDMNAGSSITVSSGAKLYAWGYITGSGAVTAKSGAAVYEYFQLADWRGGSATASMNGNKYKVFPMTQYYFQNIEAPLTLQAGASEKLYITIYAGGMDTSSPIDLIGSTDSSLFKLTSGTLTKRYDPEMDRVTLAVNGDLIVNKLSLTVKQIVTITVSSSDYVLPITSNLTVDIQSGTTTIANDTSFLPSVEVNVAQGANLVVSKNLYLYDRDQWCGKKFVGSGMDLNQISYTPEKGANVRKIRTSAGLTDAKLDVNGTLTVNGALYTTGGTAEDGTLTGGANITSSQGTGTVVLTSNPLVGGTLYGANQSGTSVSYPPVPITPAKLKNDSEEADAYSVTTGATAGDTFYYHDGMWDKENAPEGDHYPHIPETVEAVSSTCTTPGKTVGSRCAVCGKVLEGLEEIPASHTYEVQWGEWTQPEDSEDWTVTATLVCSVCESTTEGHTKEVPAADITVAAAVEKEATCAEAGKKTYTASVTVNGEVQENPNKNEVEIPKLTTHTPGVEKQENVVDATCTAAGGYDKVTHCTVCGEVLKSEHVARTPLGHDYVAGENAWTWTKDETGAYQATLTLTCQRESCAVGSEGHTKTLSATDVTGSQAKAPTCTEKGEMTYTARVTDGDKEYTNTHTEEIPASGHDLIPTEAKAATCTEAGNQAYWTCQREGCGKVFSDTAGTTETSVEAMTIPATGHKYDYSKPEWNWTEAGTGYTATVTFTCTACAGCDGHTKIETATVGEPSVIAATCMEEGSKTYTATATVNGTPFADTKIVTIPIDNDTHAWNDGEITTEPTCTQKGVKTYTCKHNSSHTKTEEVAIDSNAHSWGEGVVTTASTCTTKGVKAFTCQHDGSHTKTEEVAIDPNAHAWNDGEITTPATCTKVGVKTFTCKHDSSHTKTENVAIDSNAHDWDDGKVTKEPTCTAKGERIYTCKLNGSHTKTEEVAIDPNAHRWGNWTATEVGHTRTCAYNLAHTETAEHSFSAWVTDKEATCGAAGSKHRECTVCGYSENAEIEATGVHNWSTEWKSDDATHWHECSNCGAKGGKAGHTVITDAAVAATCQSTGLTEGSHCSVCGKVLVAQAVTPVDTNAHTWAEEFTIDAPATCGQVGSQSKHCTNPGCTATTEMTVIPATGAHSWGEGTATKEPTCTEKGEKTYTCSACGGTKTEETEALGHDFASEFTVDKEPTCTEKGSKSKHCSRCEAKDTVTVIEALGHDMQDVPDTAKEATCTETGRGADKKCSRCDYRETGAMISALGHNSDGNVERKEPTCTEAGVTGGTYCTRCGEGKAKAESVLAKLEHSWDEGTVTEVATCTKSGVRTYRCIRCGGTETEVIPTTEGTHTNIVTTPEKPATCIETGLTAGSYCEDCGRTITGREPIPMAGHTEVIDEAVAATCTTTGLTEGKHCSVCNTVLVAQEEVAMLAHTPGEAVRENEKAATCTEEGSYAEVVYCSVCKAELSRTTKTIEKLSHTLTKVEAVEPTCTEAGHIEYWTCSVCSGIFTDEAGTNGIGIAGTKTPAKGHTEVTDPAVAATCTATGLTEGKHCPVCNTVLVAQTVTDKAPHTPVISESGQAATCEADGWTEEKMCSVCGEVTQNKENIPALGHDFGEWSVTSPATCTAEGEKQRVCSRDSSHVETQTIPMKAHDYSDVEPEWRWSGSEEDGYTAEAVFTCNTCHKEQTVETDEVTSDTIDATCTESGITIYTATVTFQGKRFTSTKDGFTVGPAGHVYSTFTWDFDSEEDEGNKERAVTVTFTCTQCGYVEEVKSTSIRKETTPTCTEDGSVDYVMTVEFGGREYTDTRFVEALDALGHDEVVDPAVAATCVHTGKTAGRHCGRCGVVLAAQEVTPATGEHDYSCETRPATCTAPGSKTYTCKNCGHSYSEEIEMLPHQLTTVPARPATCTEAGHSDYKHCETCGADFGKEMYPAAGHSFDAPEFIWIQTEEGGWIAQAKSTCQSCGEVRDIAAQRLDTADTKAATCTEAGTRRYTAEFMVDGEVLTAEHEVEIPAAGHTEAVDPAKAATCTETGLTEGKHCSVCNAVLLAQEAVEALGHEYETSWTWTGSGDTTGAAFHVICKRDASHREDIQAKVEHVTTPATPQSEGKIVYTATAVYADQTYTDQKEVTLAKLPSSSGRPSGGGGGGGSSTPPRTEINDSDVPLVTLPGLKVIVTDAPRNSTVVDKVITVKLGDTVIDRVPGGVNASIPMDQASDGTVAILIGEDGGEKIIRRTVFNGSDLIVPVEGTADIAIRDNTKHFDDVSNTAWYAPAVTFVSSHELFSGTSSAAFEPATTMSRAMLAKVLHNMEYNPAPKAASNFRDVDPDIWYNSAVAWANEQGIVTGYADGNFGPNSNISRQDLVVMLWRYADKPAARGTVLSFQDADRVSDYAQDAMLWATENGIINGKGEGILDPMGRATRAEVAKIIQNYLIYLAK